MTKTHDLTIGDETNQFQLGFETGPSWRSLGGDVSQNDAFRQQIVGTTKSTFFAWETTFFVRVNSVQPFARFTYVARPDNIAIPGLTGNQLVWGVNVASTLFSAKTTD